MHWNWAGFNVECSTRTGGQFKEGVHAVVTPTPRFLALGCFAETKDLRALILDPSPGAWSRAAVLREIVLSPLPPSIALAVGFDSAHAAFDGIRTVTGKIDWLGLVDPAIEVRPATTEVVLGHYLAESAPQTRPRLCRHARNRIGEIQGALGQAPSC